MSDVYRGTYRHSACLTTRILRCAAVGTRIRLKLQSYRRRAVAWIAISSQVPSALSAVAAGLVPLDQAHQLASDSPQDVRRTKMVKVRDDWYTTESKSNCMTSAWSKDIPVYRPRQLSLGTNGTPSNGPPPSPGGALPSPGGTGVTRSRLGGASFDGVMGDAWGGAVRRRVGEPRRTVDDKLEGSWRPSGDSRFREEITEEPSADLWDVPDAHEAMPPISNSTGDAGSMDGDGSVHPQPAESGSLPHTPAPVNPATVSWCYKDPTGLVQGDAQVFRDRTCQLMSRFCRSILGNCHAKLVYRRILHGRLIIEEDRRGPRL